MIVFYAVIIYTAIRLTQTTPYTVEKRAAGVIAFILWCGAAFYITHAGYEPRETNPKYEQEAIVSVKVYNDINKYRTGYNLKPLIYSPQLYELAQIYARELCQDENYRTTNTPTPYISHVRADWATLRMRSNELYPHLWKTKTLGENLAATPTSAPMTGRHNSPTHRKVMQWTSRKQIGVGTCIVRNKYQQDTFYFVTVFSN